MAYFTLALAVFFFPRLDTLLILTNALIGVAALQNLIFRFLQSRQKVQIWLFEQTDLRIEGRIIVRLLLGVILMFAPALRQLLAVYSTLQLSTYPCAQGFDEYMNLVLDEAEEVSMKRKTRKPLGALATPH